MRAVLFQGAGKVSVDDVPEPRIEAPGDAIVKVTTTAVCGSDLIAYRGVSPTPREPGRSTGHEICGIVYEIGADVKLIGPGQRVVSPFSVFCNGCFYCKQGLLSACENRGIYGIQLGGAQAEYVRVPHADAVLEPIPEGLPDEKAIFLADLLTGVYAGLQLAGLKAGESVAVIGSGPTGLAAILLARSMGAGMVFALDHHNYRLGVAETLGATPLGGEEATATLLEATGGRGADVVIEAVGRAEALSRGVDLVRPWGTLLSLGLGIEQEASFPIGRLTTKRARLIPAYGPAVKNYMAPVANMLARAGLDPSPLVSHTLPLEDAPQAYELMAQRNEGALKVLLRP